MAWLTPLGLIVGAIISSFVGLLPLAEGVTSASMAFMTALLVLSLVLVAFLLRKDATAA